MDYDDRILKAQSQPAHMNTGAAIRILSFQGVICRDKRPKDKGIAAGFNEIVGNAVKNEINEVLNRKGGEEFYREAIYPAKVPRVSHALDQRSSFSALPRNPQCLGFE